MLLRSHFFPICVLYLATSVWGTQQGSCVKHAKPKENCSTSTVGSYSDFIGRYTFPTTPIKTLQCTSEEVMATMEKAVPVVLKNCHFGDVTQGWTTDYFKENLLSPNLTVYVSPTRKFLFYNNDKENGNYTWTPPHKRMVMNFSEFLNVTDQLDEAVNGSKAYLQSSLEKELLNSEMQDDIFMFDTLWLQKLKGKLGWGRQDLNLLLVGMSGVVTPAHYDIMENLFLQIYGKKRCILFSPESYKYLYPYPLHHPHDRQTQVNFDSPDFEKFPKFRDIEGVDAVLEPGDVLYIPNYWWHYIESEKNSKTISMNFWYLPKGDPEEEVAEDESLEMTEKDKQKQTRTDVEETKTRIEMNKTKAETSKAKGSKSKKEEDMHIKETGTQSDETEIVPLSSGELIGLSREIEAMIGNAIGNVTKVGEFLKEMVDGRYDFL